VNERSYQTKDEFYRQQSEMTARTAPPGLGAATRPPGELESIATESEALAARAGELANFVQTILSRTLMPRPERADEGARGNNYAASAVPSFSARVTGNHCEIRRELNEAFDGLQELNRALGL
jgi:hypothetical protein